ncbi:hypothetical protein GCM10009116_12240 [Brevundimonas basaltis]|uniref:DUF2927 domain-containing protein n=1 Tax=Brevundimonas basaltis TaxID=472166 RepID=A0A7W8HVP4_9CAUL|nr:hypothetical protein [Brevundimonas basaltis]MBB5290660.1 hypothetical protein [Brevundimonas basaltis]
MVRWLGLIFVLVLAGAGPAGAQTPPAEPDDQEPPVSTVEDVIVSGRPLEERARIFVEEVAQPVRSRGLARWDGPACFGVVNFSGDAARPIADQLVVRADELGLPVGELDCEPNVFIIGAVDAPAVARAWVARSPGAFQPNVSGTRGGAGALRTFVSSDAAVRWWHISIPMHFDIFSGATQPAVRLPGRPPPGLRVYARSQHGSRIRDDLSKVMVLVDIDRLGEVTIPQLCDYLLMVAYAQVDPEGDTAAYETVLNLFDDPSVAGLTEWDRSYLAALYEADPVRRVGVGTQEDRLVAQLGRVAAPE